MEICYSRVMVLDKGEIKEFDSPEMLLKDKNSVFYSLIKDSNLLEEAAEHLNPLSDSSTDACDSLSEDHSDPHDHSTKTCSSSSLSSS